MNRRKFIAFSSRVAVMCGATWLMPQIAYSQVPMPPTDLRVIEIPEDDYNRWRQAMLDAAKELAEEGDTDIDDEVEEKFDADVKETFEDQGYRIRPKPPTNLTVE